MESERRFLMVDAGGRRYGVPVACVRQVIQTPDLYPVPGAGPHLLGLGQYGGEPLAVVDVEALCDADAGSAGMRGLVVVVAPRDGLLVGLAVDRALQVAPVQLPIEAREAGLAAGGVDGDVTVLDPSWLADSDRDSSKDAR